MRSFSLEQYQRMAKKFNAMSFKDQIKTIRDNNDILKLGSDHNFWVVFIKDEVIQREFQESDWNFLIEPEWGSREMCDLIDLLGIDNGDI